METETFEKLIQHLQEAQKAYNKAGESIVKCLERFMTLSTDKFNCFESELLGMRQSKQPIEAVAGKIDDLESQLKEASDNINEIKVYMKRIDEEKGRELDSCKDDLKAAQDDAKEVCDENKRLSEGLTALRSSLSDAWDIYQTYKNQEEFASNMGLTVANYEGFVLSCNQNLAKIYSLAVEQIAIGESRSGTETLVNDVIKVYNCCHTNKLKRQSVTCDSKFASHLHQDNRHDHYADAGDVITEVLLQGVVFEGGERRVFDECRACVLTERRGGNG